MLDTFLSVLRPCWSIVIFAAREAPDVLFQSVDAAIRASPPGTTIEVIVNGNRHLLDQVVARYVMAGQNAESFALRFWFIPFGDKANAWNQYIHTIWADQELVFFVDGYAQVKPDAISLLGNSVMSQDFVLGGTGVPTVGRSAAALRANLLKNGGIHGNLCCVKGRVMSRMRARGIRLPVGLYRTDSLVETFLVYDLNPEKNEWDDRRVYVHPDATWAISVPHGWRVSNMQTRWNRLLRQALGDIEKGAFRELFAIRKIELPLAHDSSLAMVEAWVHECPKAAKKLIRFHPLRRLALQKLRQFRPQAPDQLKPQLVWSGG